MRTHHGRAIALLSTAALLAASCGGSDDVTTTGTTETAATGAAATETTSPGDESPMSMETHAATETSTGGMETPTGEGMDMSDGEEMEMSGSYGEPADPSEADRTIDVTVANEFAFDPDTFEVAAGEVVTFRITNEGALEHEFVLGDEEAQQQMADEMSSDDDGHAHAGGMSNAVTIHGGETAELTWRFTEPGEVLVGCHVQGHWEGGMRGRVVVS